MRKLSTVALALSLTLVTSTAVQAGARWISGVSIYKSAGGGGGASGALGSVRNSSDNSSYLYCYVENSPAVRNGVSCGAYDGTNYIGCSGIVDAGVADMISKLGSDAYIWFQVDPSGSCSRVQIGQGSPWAPKAP